MYTFCGQTLTSVDSHCYIGIHLSNTLNWTAHTKLASTKAQQTLGVIRRNLNKCTTHVNRWSIQYYNMPRQHGIHTVKTIRFCTNNYSRESGSVTKLLQELGWETLQTRRTYKRITTLYKMEHNIIDIPLDQYIKHNTRCSRKHNSQFLQIRHSCNTFGNSCFPTTAKERNALPSNKHYFKQLNRNISKKLKQISDRPLADKPPCVLARCASCATATENAADW